MRRNYTGAGRGGNGLHATTVLNTQNATGFIWTGSVNEGLRVGWFLVVENCDNGVLGRIRGRGGTVGFFGRSLVGHDTRRGGLGGR